MDLSFGQRVGGDGLVQPWLTHGALDWLEARDFSDKNVLMFGAGLGDSWLANRCKTITVVERNGDWLAKASMACNLNGISNITYLYRPCDDCTGLDAYYTDIPSEKKFDIIINDDAYRTELCQVAVDYFKDNGGGTLICDNWYQSYVWMSPKAVEIMEPYERLIFEQADHKDNDGVNKWKTAIFFIK